MYTWYVDSRRRVIDPAADSDTTPRGTDKDQEGARREHSSGSENRTTATTAVSCFAILRGFETFSCPLCKGVAPGSAVHRTTFSIYPTIPLVPTRPAVNDRVIQNASLLVVQTDAHSTRAQSGQSSNTKKTATSCQGDDAYLAKPEQQAVPKTSRYYGPPRLWISNSQDLFMMPPAS